ncbi:MAG TPA: HlyD family efflux transporter periplasmic adaptor subunit [Aestuariivirga sp.]|jgi:HlyD family secretion protein|nr:HlyD family efflux transporter periplasmic adaptor subunit [Aestuariivirga sp.]
MAVQWIKRILLLAALAVMAGGFTWLMWPQPIQVDVAKAILGRMQLTVDEEGISRIREVYTVSAPVAGKVARSPREVGDHVVAGVTPVAAIRSADPTMLDARTRLELQAAIEAAKADVEFASAAALQAEKELRFADAELGRTRYLVGKKVMALNALEKRQLEADGARQRLESAKAQLDVRLHNLEMAQARLLEPASPGNAKPPDDCCISLTSPVNGIILRIPVENEQVIQAGTPLVEIGNPFDTEISVDLLSTDAIQVKPGAPAVISGWGGTDDLKARVKRVDPAAFTKISALGIEEQRVKAILEITDPPAKWTGLGHEYRVFVHIAIWQSENALQIPLSALFRWEGNWAVFRVEGGLAKLTRITAGQINSSHVQVLSGLNAGETVIVHPSDLIADGVQIERRAAGKM